MNKAWFAVLASLLVSAGCEHGPPVTTPLVPQPAFTRGSVSPEARAQLRGMIDLEALDRLLITLGPEERERFLATFEEVEWSASGRSEMETRGVSIIIQFSDTERQRLLQHVWLPFWSHLPPAALSDPAYPLPGRSLAITRRADSAAVVKKGRDP